MEKPCPKFATAKDLMDAPRGSIDPANAVRRRVGLKKFEPPKGTILVNDIVWMLYYWDHGPMIVSIHASAQQAVEANTDNHSIGQWKLDTDFREAVKQWESRNEKKDES